MESKLPPGWTYQVSKSTGKGYYHHAATNTSQWHPPTASSSISSQAAPANLKTSETFPSLGVLPDDIPPWSTENFALDLYCQRYRARDAWLPVQLGLDQLKAELQWWTNVDHSKPEETVPYAPHLSTAHAMLGIEQGTQGCEESLRRERAEIDKVTAQLASAVLQLLGTDKVVASWNSKRRLYVINREMLLGSDVSDGLPHPKRPRVDRGTDVAGAGAFVAPSTIIRPRDSYIQVKGVSLYTTTELMPNDVIREVYREGKVMTGSGTMKKLTSAIGPYEGMHMYNVVRDNKFTRTCEVGMANGMSSLYICQALRDNGGGRHISIDPFQATQWDNTARTALQRAKLDDLSTVVEEPCYLAMPDLVRKGYGQQMDLVFVDGMHLFDYTLVDIFYADLLTKVGGVILLDDIKHAGVMPVKAYLDRNYKHWMPVVDTGCDGTLATYVKLATDSRSWDFHVSFPC